MLVIIVILIGLNRNKKKLIYIAIGVLYILSTPIFSNNFFKLVEGSEYRKPICAIDCADAIVVLSGMLQITEVGDSTYIEWGVPDRFFWRDSFVLRWQKSKASNYRHRNAI
jgi:hypothetical protein